MERGRTESRANMEAGYDASSWHPSGLGSVLSAILVGMFLSSGFCLSTCPLPLHTQIHLFPSCIPVISFVHVLVLGMVCESGEVKVEEKRNI